MDNYNRLLQFLNIEDKLINIITLSYYDILLFKKLIMNIDIIYNWYIYNWTDFRLVNNNITPGKYYLVIKTHDIEIIDNIIDTSDKHLVKYEISDNKITSLEITQFYDKNLNFIIYFRNITSLCLHNNKLKQFPKSICLMKTLKILLLDNNLIEKIPDDIKNLCNLEKLFLWNNQITEINDNLKFCLRLKILSLSNNKISQISDTVFNMPSLSEIYLQRNLL